MGHGRRRDGLVADAEHLGTHTIDDPTRGIAHGCRANAHVRGHIGCPPGISALQIHLAPPNDVRSMDPARAWCQAADRMAQGGVTRYRARRQAGHGNHKRLEARRFQSCTDRSRARCRLRMSEGIVRAIGGRFFGVNLPDKWRLILHAIWRNRQPSALCKAVVLVILKLPPLRSAGTLGSSRSLLRLTTQVLTHEQMPRRT